MNQIRNSVEVEAPAAAVWQVLTEFEHYPDWNGFIRQVNGRAVAGARLRMVVALPGRPPKTLKSKILVADAGKELCWRSWSGFPGLLNCEHRFLLEASKRNRCRLIQSEDFSGLLQSMVGQDVLDLRDRAFTAMNHALKIRAENL